MSYVYTKQIQNKHEYIWRTEELFVYLGIFENMNNYKTIKKIKDMNNTDLVVKYTFGTMAATLLIMNIAAFGVIIVNGIISLI